jgi:hypothetical protein
VAGLFLPPLVAPLVAPWSEMNCRHEEINIKTGQARYSRYLWFVKVAERVEDTPLSLALQGETVDVKSVPAWERVNTFSRGTHHSPHYRYHAALWQANQMKMIASMRELTSQQKREIARDILTTWQKSGNYHGVNKLLANLEEESPKNRLETSDK